MQDAHLHLQDSRFQDTGALVVEMSDHGISHCVVNGTSPDDWGRVAELSHCSDLKIIPSFGLHPWQVEQVYAESECEWKTQLSELLRTTPSACIGECGLDRWIKNPNRELQEDAFLFQLSLARELNLPLSIHILKAWGWFIEILRREEFPRVGFLLHSYNGSKELIPELVERGAYFSFSGYYLHERKAKTLDVFRHIPLDRLLVETDAPDMLPPEHIVTHPLTDKDGKQINHPAHLPSIAKHLASALGIQDQLLNEQLHENFERFFLNRDAVKD